MSYIEEAQKSTALSLTGDLNAAANKFFRKLGGYVAGGTAVTLGGVIYRDEISDAWNGLVDGIVTLQDLVNFLNEEDAIEGAQVAAVADHSNQDLAIAETLVEDGGTFAVLSGRHADRLTGNSAANLLSAGDGTDTLSGGAGDDLLTGGAGADQIDGVEGFDTLDYSESQAGVAVNLATGDGRGGQAEGDVIAGIEAVVGSAHADALTGDDQANALIGSDGADTLTGGAGDDLLIGGQGADVLEGGEGSDTVDYSEAAAGVSVNLESGLGQGGEAEGDVLSGLEHVVGSAHGDALTGSSEANALNGGGGDDALSGLAGDDHLVGGAGADVLDGGAGYDTAYYTASGAGVTVDLTTGIGQGGDAAGDVLSGLEQVIGSAHADSLTGSAEANLLSGLSGDDVLVGGDGDDVLVGGAGADVLDGGMGEDLADYTGSDAGVVVDLRAGTGAGGEAAGDWLDGVDHVLGSLFDDQLLGQDGWGNLLSGGFGNDVLDGRSGADTLIGGAGDDALTGGADADVFGFAGAIGHDVISDFESGVDVISFAAEDEDFADGVSVLQAAEQVGEHVLIRLDDERSLTLANTQLTSLSDAAFTIAA
ncbi:calcium-binding protein [Microvirga tunisiensis]|uniref:calcium-binding protein n=1 Tax=Microvirga tunisiensis TaxID=2108360 RepID=UPI0030B8F4C0